MNTKTFFYRIVPLIMVIGCVTGFILYSRNEEQLSKIKNVESYILSEYKNIRKATLKIGAAENCTADITYSRVGSILKNGDYYERSIKDTVIEEKITKDTKNTSKEEQAFCNGSIDALLKITDDSSKLKLLNDNKTLIDLSDDSIYMCIPRGKSITTCTYNKDVINSKLAKDGCIEYTQKGDSIMYSGHFCKENKYRKNEPYFKMEAVMIDGLDAKVSLSIKILSE